MAVKQVSQILDQVRRDYGRLRALYEAWDRTVTDPRTSMLLEYMADREARLQETLERFLREQHESVLSAWFKVVPDEPLGDLFAQAESAAPSTMDEAYERAMGFEERLLGFFRQLAAESNSLSVRKLFEDLAHLEGRNERSLSKALNRAGDL